MNQQVLIPRPETEFLVEFALERINSSADQPKVLDVGTGSGAIVLSLAKSAKKEASFFASDVSEGALKVARKNALALGLEEKVKFQKSDLLSDIKENKFNVITANLPYVPHEDMAGLSFDIHHWEPRLALDGGVGGLEIYQRFLSQVDAFLQPEGWLICEIGKDQGNTFDEMAKKFIQNIAIEVKKDYSGIDRLVTIQKKN